MTGERKKGKETRPGWYQMMAAKTQKNYFRWGMEIDFVYAKWVGVFTVTYVWGGR